MDLTPIRRLQELPSRWYDEAVALLERGENDRALAKLSAAAELDPKSEPVQQLLAKTRRNEPGGGNRTFAIAAFVILALIAIGALIMAFRRPAQTPIVQATLLPTPAPKATSVPPPFPLTELETRLANRDDVRVDREGDALKVTFKDGLFPSGSDTLTPSGRARLESIARELAAVRVNIEGFTDANPPPPERWKDNWSLAFSRAHEAVEVLRATSGAGVTWVASSSGDLHAPFPDKDKNRTVVLHIERGTP